MSQTENLFSVLVVACSLAALLGMTYGGCCRSHADRRICERFVDSSKNTIYCKECKKREYISMAFVRFRKRFGTFDWYSICIKTNKHKDESFVYSLNVDRESNCISLGEQEEGPGYGL